MAARSLFSAPRLSPRKSPATISIATAVKTTIAGLTLTGISAGSILLKELPSDRAADGVALPAVLVTHPPSGWMETGSNNAVDDWVFPVLVTILKAGNQSNTWDDAFWLWVETCMFAFHNRRLSGVALAFNCLVVPNVILDSGMFHDENLKVNQFVVRVFYRRTRS